jgi:hypothetical protein
VYKDVHSPAIWVRFMVGFLLSLNIPPFPVARPDPFTYETVAFACPPKSGQFVGGPLMKITPILDLAVNLTGKVGLQ